MSGVSTWIQAVLWGGLAGSALIIGSLSGYFFKLSQRAVAGVMAFGSGALISALSFEMVGKAYDTGGLLSTATGFVLGAIIYSAANYLVSNCGAVYRKRSNLSNKLDADQLYNNARAIAVGALIDGIPESIVIGLGLLQGGAVSVVTVIAIFVSNVPEALSSSVGMKNKGKSLVFILSIWGGIAVISSIFSGIGYLAFQNVSISVVAVTMAVAAGAILSMIVDTMIPEAFEETHNFAGLITVIGFLCAFILEKM